MIISRIILKNWRNFSSVDVPLGRRVFLIGPNASGKSNFLDAFRFLRDIAKPGGGLEKAVKDRGGITKIRCLSAKREPQVGIEVHLAETYEKEAIWKYAISIKYPPSGKRRPNLEYEKVWENGKLILERPNEEDKKDELLLTQTHLEQISANFKFREIAKSLESIDYFHLIPQLIRNPENFSGPITSEDPFGRAFLENISKTPQKTRESRLRKIEKALQAVVPQLKKLSTTKDSRGVPHLEVVYEHWRAYGAKQSEEELSDGTLRLIGFLWSMFEGDSLLLLEEPELSLHVDIVRKLPGLIWRMQSNKKKRRQVIISTHSPELLNDKGIEGEEVLILTPAVEGTRVETTNSIEDVRLLMEGGMSVGEAAIPLTKPKTIDQLSMFDE